MNCPHSATGHPVFWHNLLCMIPVTKKVPRPGTICLLLLALGLCCSAHAQEATVTFNLDFPGSEPSHYTISVSSDGHSTYDSDGKLSPDSEGDPFHLDFSMSAETKRRIFDLAERAHYFEGEIDSRKKGLA